MVRCIVRPMGRLCWRTWIWRSCSRFSEPDRCAHTRNVRSAASRNWRRSARRSRLRVLPPTMANFRKESAAWPPRFAPKAGCHRLDRRLRSVAALPRSDTASAAGRYGRSRKRSPPNCHHGGVTLSPDAAWFGEVAASVQRRNRDCIIYNLIEVAGSSILSTSGPRRPCNRGGDHVQETALCR